MDLLITFTQGFKSLLHPIDILIRERDPGSHAHEA